MTDCTQSAAAPFSLALLGGFTATIAGQPMRKLRTRHGSRLLALLALHAGKPHDRMKLADALWPESGSDENALASLRRTLTDLRAALGPEAGRLQTISNYALTLDLEGAFFDVREFDLAVKVKTRTGLDRAISLYHGPLMPDLDAINDFDGLVQTEREPRHQLFLEALEQRADLLEAGGETKNAVADLRRLLAFDPLRQSTSRRLMEILHRNKDRDGARVEYQRLQQGCVNFQTELEPETQVLWARLQKSTFPFVFPVASSSDAAKVDAAPSFNNAISVLGLPVPLTRFFGREAELNLLEDWITGEKAVRQRLITLTGSPGMGKTRLAVEAAQNAAQSGGLGAAWFVSLADVRDPSLAATALSRALGLTGQKGGDVDAIADVLREASPQTQRPVLLVLDNVEQLIASETDASEDIIFLVRRLLTLVPHLVGLVTSRHPLLLGGEQEMRLESLEVPDENAPIFPNSGVGCAGVALFLDRARLANPTFATGGAKTDAPTIAALCRRLEGVPLALEMAAAQMRVLTPSTVLAQLTDRLGQLATAQRDLPPRQRSLYAAIDWSYDLLSGPEKSLFSRLSVFAGGWTESAAETVCGFAPVETESVSRTLTGLVSKSLLLAHASGGESETPRYRMLESLRQYAGEKRESSGETQRVRNRHLDWCLCLAEQAGPEIMGHGQTKWLPLLEAEHGNMRAALDWSDEADQAKAAAGETSQKAQERRFLSMRLARSLDTFWYVRGYFAEGLRRLEKPVREIRAQKNGYREAFPEATRLFAEVLSGAGLMAFGSGDLAEARNLTEESVALYRTLGDTKCVASLLKNLGGISASMGEYQTGRSYLEESLALMREWGDPVGIGGALTNLGDVAKSQGDYEVARAYLSEGVAAFQKAGERHGIAMALNNMGEVAACQSQWEEARSLFQRALSVRQTLGDRRGLAFSLRGLAGVCLEEAETWKAVLLWGASDTLLQSIAASLPTNEQEKQDAQLARARSVLGEETFCAVYEQGCRLTQEQAVGLAGAENDRENIK